MIESICYLIGGTFVGIEAMMALAAMITLLVAYHDRQEVKVSLTLTPLWIGLIWLTLGVIASHVMH